MMIPKIPDQLYNLLHQCTVRIPISQKTGEQGTGFFVAPGFILTCAHVLKTSSSDIEILWETRTYSTQVIKRQPEVDLALLKVDLEKYPALREHPCVAWDAAVLPFDDLYSYGYPDNHPEGDPATFELEGKAGERGEQFKFKVGQVRPGFSGAPLLNVRTRQVCGVIQITRDRSTDLGGRAIPISIAMDAFPDILPLQQQFHLRDRRWIQWLLEEAPSTTHTAPQPQSYLPFRRNVLFQLFPGAFERLEALLFEANTITHVVRRGPVGIVGMGGSGKTQLAIEFAYRSQERFPAGIFWMPATGTSLDWQHRLAVLSRDVNYLPADDDESSSENERRRARHFCQYLALHDDALLILDNVEDPDLVISVLPALAGSDLACATIYTTRNMFSPAGTAVYAMELLPDEAAVRLLLESSRTVLLTEVLAGRQNAEVQAVHIICQGVGYLPLALVHLRTILARDQHVTLERLANVLQQRGAIDLARTKQGDAEPLMATFRLSWEKVQQEDTQVLFKLAAYFPEAAPIPLWLLGLASGLGESGDIFEPLGEALVQLREWSLIEGLSGELVRLHPLLREFGQRLIVEEGNEGKGLLVGAGKRLAEACSDLHWLEQRARRDGYRECLEQVRVMRGYAELLEAEAQAEQIGRIERWLDRESYLLADQRWWPTQIPGLFYQQLFNHMVEARLPLPPGESPQRWLRQTKPTGREDQALLRRFIHSAMVYSVAFSPDGKLILTGSGLGDGIAQLWEVSTGRELLQLQSHRGTINSVAFSPDGKLILAGAGGIAQLWEVNTGRELLQLQGHQSFVNSVAFSPDGKLILTGSGDGTARLWEVSTGRELARLQAAKVPNNTGSEASYTDEDRVECVAFSPDGKLILTGSRIHSSGIAQLWEVRQSQRFYSRKPVISVREPKNLVFPFFGGINSVAFSPNGKLILINSSAQGIYLLEVSSRLVLAQLMMPGSIKKVAFSPDGQLAILCHESGHIYFWHMGTPEPNHLFGIYVAAYEICALHWQDATHIVLADTGGARGYPYFYYLSLEGKQGDLEGAQAAYRQALASEDADATPEARFRLGELLAEQGDVEGAKVAFRQALASGHADNAAYAAFHLGALLAAQGDAEGAQAAYRQALASEDVEVAAVAAFYLGELLEKQGDLEGAQAFYRQALASGYTEMAHWAALRLGLLLDAQGDVEGAKALYQQALASGHAKAAPRAAFHLGVLLTQQGDLEGAQAAYQQALASEDVEVAAAAAINLGELLEKQGDLEGAQALYQQAIASGHAEAAAEATKNLGRLRGTPPTAAS